MALKDQIRFIFRWPVIKALPNRIRRILSADSRLRTLKMPVLETERLVLRQLDQHDLRDIIAWEEATWVQNTDVAAQEFLDYCFREYRERGIGPWGIQLKQTRAIVGNCGFPHINFKSLCGEVNYYVAPRYRGQGLAPEALKALLKFGFQDIGLARIQARCEFGNLSSERVTQKAEMRFEGLIEDPTSSNSPNRKQKLFAILEKDFEMGAAGMLDGASGAKAQPDGRSERC